MPVINISVENKIAEADGTLYVCGNSDFVAKFAFDAEWESYENKTARFCYNNSYVDVVFTGDKCPVPIISGTYFFNIGVYAGDLHTTTPARVPCKKSILCDTGFPADPPNDVYNQIMAKLNSLGSADPEAIAKAVADYLAAHPIEETDPTVPEWAKAETKPTYTADEVGAISQDDLQTATNNALAQAKASGEFDGSAGAPGKDGAGMDITGATVGQIVKITAVDASGVPTAWSPVDMPGGEEKWEKIAEIVIPEGADESTALTISQDFDGNQFSLVKARLCAKFPKYTGATTIPNFSFAMLNGKAMGRETPIAYTSVWPKVSKSAIAGVVYEIDVSGAQQIERSIRSGNGGWSDDTSRDYVVYGTTTNIDVTWHADTLWAKPITSIGGTGMLIYPGCSFVLYGVRA